MTVRRYLEADGWIAYRRPRRARRLAGFEAWLAEHFRRHRDYADVLQLQLERKHGIAVSLRTVERAVQELHRELVAEAKATVRFETPPGRQLPIDFGSTTLAIAGEPERQPVDADHPANGFLFRADQQLKPDLTKAALSRLSIAGHSAGLRLLPLVVERAPAR